jgi:hypothetical protein
VIDYVSMGGQLPPRFGRAPLLGGRLSSEFHRSAVCVSLEAPPTARDQEVTTGFPCNSKTDTPGECT